MSDGISSQGSGARRRGRSGRGRSRCDWSARSWIPPRVIGKPAVLDLREEQPVLAARMFSLSCGEEGREMRQPLLTAGHQIPRSERVGEFLQAIGSCAFQEGIGNLLESDTFLTHAVRQPMVLVEQLLRRDGSDYSSP